MLLFSYEEDIKKTLKGVLTITVFYFSVDSIVKSGQSSEINWAVLFCGTVHYAKMLR